MSRVSPQLLVFSYHKTGTSLFLHVMTKLCERLGLALENRFGLVERLSPEPDVVLLPHSMLRCPIDWPYRAVRLIRDPRDIWVSGYLYHRHCAEEWCTNTDIDPTPPIGWPRVDHAFAHRSEDWKRAYLDRLDGRSYQQNLLERSPDDGLDFELEGYTGCTLAAMREWVLNGVDAMDVRLEDVTADFDGTMTRIFEHFGFTPEQREAALEVARTEDVNRMDDAAIADRPQIHSRRISKWREVLSPAQLGRFEARHGDLIRDLGYAPACTVVNGVDGADDWFRPGLTPLMTDEAGTGLIWPGANSESGHEPLLTRTARPGEVCPGEVWLSADGVVIRPTVAGEGRFSFVVPPHVGHVRLESRRSVSLDPRAPYLGSSSSRGLKVSEIEIRSRAGETVIPADDPRLVTGWYDPEHVDGALWRWTDGSAELPWVGVLGPAVVVVRCETSGDFLAGGEALRPVSRETVQGETIRMVSMPDGSWPGGS
jgi:hypothetical protein